MVDLVVKEFGRIDYAVNSAGVSDLVSILSSTYEVRLISITCCRLNDSIGPKLEVAFCKKLINNL